jgi:hypothetical protein
MFLALDTGPPHVIASSETLCYVPNVRYQRQLDRVTLEKGKYGSFVGLKFDRGWLDGYQ